LVVEEDLSTFIYNLTLKLFLLVLFGLNIIDGRQLY